MQFRPSFTQQNVIRNKFQAQAIPLKIETLFKIEISHLKITHMWRRWDTLQNFFLAFIDKLEKQIIIKKTVEWVNKKKQNNFNIYVLFKKEKKNTELQSETGRIFCHLGHFLPFQPQENLENQNFKIEKNIKRYYTFTH